VVIVVPRLAILVPAATPPPVVNASRSTARAKDAERSANAKGSCAKKELNLPKLFWNAMRNVKRSKRR